MGIDSKCIEKNEKKLVKFTFGSDVGIESIYYLTTYIKENEKVMYAEKNGVDFLVRNCFL